VEYLSRLRVQTRESPKNIHNPFQHPDIPAVSKLLTPYHPSLNVEFHVFGKHFVADLNIEPRSWHPQAIVKVYSNGEKVEEYHPALRTYRGNLTVDGWMKGSMVASVVDWDAGVFRAYFEWIDSDANGVHMATIDPRNKHEANGLTGKKQTFWYAKDSKPRNSEN
jgi:hypothetical protein